MHYLMSHPGVSYEKACVAVGGLPHAPAGPVSTFHQVFGTGADRGGPDPTKAPKHHEQALAYLLEHPVSYEQAYSAVERQAAEGRAAAERPVLYQRDPYDLAGVRPPIYLG
jgi:hypothetical protein